MFSLMCIRTNGWTNSLNTGDWRRHGVHYDVSVMKDAKETQGLIGIQYFTFEYGSIWHNIKGNILNEWKIL